jgi:outer membrane protein TolC
LTEQPKPGFLTSLSRGAFLLWLLAGCVHYQPAPLDPEALPHDYNLRTLGDSGLRSYLLAAGESPGDSTWTPRQLAVVALYYDPALDRARAEWKAAEAAEITAGARPQPGVQSDLERTFSGDRTGDPWGVSFNVVLTLELGGKRGARLAEARANTLAAEAALRADAWETVDRTRQASLALLGAERRADAANRVETALREIRPLAQARYAEGAVSRTELARIDADVQRGSFEARSLLADLYMARAGLGRATFLPQGEVPSVTTDMPVGCAAAKRTARDSLQRLALASRWQLREAQAGYAAAEARVRLQVAEQYPDLQLGPGLFFDHGENKWTLLFGLPSLLLNRNRGPIAESEAARSVAATRFTEEQEAVLSELDAALIGCSGGESRLLAADSLSAAANEQLHVVAEAFERGETARLDVATAEVLVTAAERSRLDAGLAQDAAGLALEAALGTWLDDSNRPWPDPTLPPRGQSGPEQAH